MYKKIFKIINDHAEAIEHLRQDLVPVIGESAARIIACLHAGGTVFWCGNGGSAADAQHMAAELVGRFERDRPAYASVALSTDTSILTSVGNDYGFDNIFSRQVEGLGKRGDILMALSTSGNSSNVIRAVELAKQKGMISIGLLGRDGGKLKSICDLSIVVPVANTARIQEMHSLIGHILCDQVETASNKDGQPG